MSKNIIYARSDEYKKGWNDALDYLSKHFCSSLDGIDDTKDFGLARRVSLELIAAFNRARLEND